MGSVTSFPLTTIVSQTLADVAGMTPEANKVIVGDGTNFVTSSSLTNVTVTSSTIDSTTIGSTTRAGANFTTVDASSSVATPSVAVKGASSGTTILNALSAASGTMTVPSGTDRLVARDTTDTLTNKTLTSPTINGAALSGTVSGAPTLSGANFITNSNLAQAGASTLRGNPTGSTANVQDFSPSGLTLKASPASGDIVLIQDSAASNAFKYTTAGALSTVGSVASIGGATGAITLSGDALSMVGTALTSSAAEKLTANRTYYIRSDGSDSNNGLSNTAGGAFLTWAAAIAAVAKLNPGGYTITLNFGKSGDTYTVPLSVTQGQVPIANYVIQGTSTTIQPSTAQNACLNFSGFTGLWTVNGITVATGGAGTNGVLAQDGAQVRLGTSMVFGTMTGGAHWGSLRGSNIQATANYSITGSAAYHFYCDDASYLNAGVSLTITSTGSPNFTSAFAYCHGNGAQVHTNGNTYSGTVTGKRFNVDINGSIDPGSSSVTYFPGDSSGTVTTGYYGGAWYGDRADSTSVVASGSAVSLTTSTAANVTSISIGPGTWDINALTVFTGGTTTTVTAFGASISSASATLNTTPGRLAATHSAGATIFNNAFGLATKEIPPYRLTVASTTTIYLVAYATFATSTCSAYGKLTATPSYALL